MKEAPLALLKCQFQSSSTGVVEDNAGMAEASFRSKINYSQPKYLPNAQDVVS